MVSPVLGVVLFYCACSGGMLVINKLAVHHVGAPAFVTLVQFAATVAFVGGGWLGGRISLDAARWSRLRHFVVYVLAFSMGTWANMKVLMTANVETVIVFRSCAPLVCARALSSHAVHVAHVALCSCARRHSLLSLLCFLPRGRSA